MQAPFADPLSGIELLITPLPLVGREAEMRVICALLDTVAQQKPVGARALMMSGDVGVGKSRLLAEMCLEARSRHFSILEGRTYESGGMFPYLPFIEALRPVIHSTAAATLRSFVGLENRERRDATGPSISLIGAPLVAALSRLFPELPHLLGRTITPEILTPEQEKFRLFDAVATFLERMAAERPLMLSIDNLQWADSASLELTMYLTVRLHSSPVALVGVTRPPASMQVRGDAETAHQSATALRMLSELMRQGLLLFLPIHPLSADAAGRHLQMLLPGNTGNAHVLLARAEGNPFFLEELVRMLTLNGQLVQRDGTWHISRTVGPELPASISLAVEQRLQGLSAPCLELLRVASLFGRTFPLQALVMVLRESDARVQAFIDEAVQSSVIARSPDASATFWEELADEAEEHYLREHVSRSPDYIFCQVIVQEVLSNQVPAYQARTLHGRIGTALEAFYGGHAPAAELARHYVMGGEQEAALRWSLLAGEHAVRQQAHREAIGHFRVALQMLDTQAARSEGRSLPWPAQLHIAIGESWFKLGELGQATQAFQQALEQLQLAREASAVLQPPTLLAAQANRLLADVYRMQGKYELTLAHLQAARDALDVGKGTREDTGTYSEQTLHVSWMSSRRSSPGAAGLQQVSITERILLLQAQATMEMLFNRAEEAEQALWQSHQLATEMGDRGSQAFALHLIGWIRGWGVHIHEAIRLQEQAHELYVAIGDPFRAALGDQGLGIIYQALGEMEKARLHNLRGFELARRYGVRHVLGWLHWNQGAMALAEGNWAGCETHLQQAMQEAEATCNARLKPLVIQAQAELAFRRGDWRQAELLFQSDLVAAKNTEWYPSAMALYGHFLAVTGRTEAAKAQLEQAAVLPEPVGYSGHFYVPMLAEGFLHLGIDKLAATYSKRIQELHGLMYYGVSVDRILGEIAALEGDWETAERAFEDGLALCRRVHNQPEEAAILYEQARTSLMRTSGENERMPYSLERIHSLCNEARELFLRYEMRRAADLVDTLQEGVRQLDARDREGTPGKITVEHGVHADYRLELHLTRRELDVMRLVAEGHTDREVAETLIISARTVNRHLSNVFVKLDVHGRAAAVAFAIRQGLVG